jgi:hypothetical protein
MTHPAPLFHLGWARRWSGQISCLLPLWSRQFKKKNSAEATVLGPPFAGQARSAVQRQLSFRPARLHKLEQTAERASGIPSKNSASVGNRREYTDNNSRRSKPAGYSQNWFATLHLQVWDLKWTGFAWRPSVPMIWAVLDPYPALCVWGGNV